MFRILAVNPGSTSTKISLFEDERCLWQKTVPHRDRELAAAASWEAQGEMRRAALTAVLRQKGVEWTGLDALAVRGGLLKPLPSGVYTVDRTMYEDLLHCRYGRHASNLGGIIAYPLTRERGLPAYTVDPVTVDEFDAPARFSGLAGIERLSMSHALNMKAVARRAAAGLGRDYEALNFVVAHLGGGISVSAHRRGRMVDVNNANNEGPFSLERCGTLPVLALIGLCFGGTCDEAGAVELVTSKGGVFSYLGTRDFREVERRIAAGETEALLVTEAMAYQVAKEIGAMAAVLDGAVDRIILTGGMARSALFTGMIERKVSFLAPVLVLPGEAELEALALGALRVLRGEVEARPYGLA